MPKGSRLPVATAAAVAACLPDLDVLAFVFRIPYAAEWGHRGAGHSLLVGSFLGILAFVAVPSVWRSSARVPAASALLLAGMSHSILDAFTNGGLGVALYWPVMNERVFFSFRPIRVSPIGLGAFLSRRGAEVLLSELRWVIGPALLFATSSVTLRRLRGSRGA